jgi:formylglycine-generating enzyme required for sulfatase activity
MNAENPTQIEYIKYSYRVARGGLWISIPYGIRASYRYDFDPLWRDNGIGFRFVRNK